MAVLAVVVATLVQAGPAGARQDPDIGVGIHLLDAPVSRRDDSRAHHYIVDHLKPGTTIRRRVVVRNASTVPREIAVYPAAAVVDKDQWVVEPARTANELSSWISLEGDRLELDPGRETTVWANIVVPKDASAGERYAVIWAEIAGLDGSNVRHVGRAGVRVYLSVGEGGEPPSDFTIGDVTGTRAADGTAVFTAQVHNVGGRALDLDGTLSLVEGPDGLSAGPFKVEAPTLALGATSVVRVPIGVSVPDGPWTARLELGSGWTRRKAEGKVLFSQAAPVAQADGMGPVLTAGAGISGLALLLLIGYGTRYLLVRRRATYR